MSTALRIIYTDFVFLDEVDECRSFDLDRLTLAVIERQHKVKEVALAKVARRLFLEVRPSHSETMNIHAHRQTVGFALLLQNRYTFNPLKCSVVRQWHLKVYSIPSRSNLHF